MYADKPPALVEKDRLVDETITTSINQLTAMFEANKDKPYIRVDPLLMQNFAAMLLVLRDDRRASLRLEQHYLKQINMLIENQTK